ncbi:LysM peptidoglycan-binding domain-containing protein [Citrobacter freundii]|uniref:LysM peptidoglycan-binding domain-containing protein n=1 Tax=Citrobacter freundii TaxID=546 RepID=UPI00177DFB6D|nr:LysM peptidoglycan-binding domain-containing protein [Citrobacter freundii]MBE0003857.1 LysM peptidoglycan-binding domain-containing protein [Citrobacter freundii]
MKIIPLLLVLLSCSATRVEAADDQFGVAYPFKTPLSRENFKKCYPEVKDDELKGLEKLRWYGYQSFGLPEECPEALGNDCKPGTKFFLTTRVMRFETDINQSSFNGMLNSMQGGKCSYNRMRNRSFTVERNRVSAHFQAFHQERLCVGDANTDVADGSVDIDLWATLNDDFSISRGKSESNRKSSFLNFIDGGLLDNIGLSLISLNLSGIAPLLVSSVIQLVAFKGFSNDLNFASSGIDLYRYSSVRPILDSIGQVKPQTEYKFDRSASGFLVEGSIVSIETVQTAYTLEIIRNPFIGTRRMEVEFLSDLNEVSPSMHTVVKGETLWDIVGKKYRDPRLFLVVARKNNLRRGEILIPGKVLALPRWQELCGELTTNPLAVRKGDSLWKKAARGEIPRDLKQVKTMSGKRNLIYPLEVLTVKTPATLASEHGLSPRTK